MEFKKSGFNEEDSATLAGVAAMYQNVADDAISAGESANFIISQMKAFGLEAEDATHIIDALNEVSNTQAVSSADLANNLGKASAAMALGNNTYEQSLAMMTAITEINRSGAKSARALVSVQSRLTQVLDEQSSTGKALVEIYDGLGIALKDQNGQLRPTFEIFKDLAKLWPNLTTNQRDYIALTQAGANQTSNFVALMDNFEAALKAEATAMESSGSAARENAAYMESLEAQTTQLKATFQDFANNVIDKELVSSALKGLNTALEVLNTPIGKTVTQWTLLTGVFTGGITIYGQIAGKLGGIAKTVGIDLFNSFKNLTMVVSGAQGPLLATGTAFGTATSMALPFAAALSTIAIVGWEVYKWYKETHKPLQEYTEEIESNTKQLEQNRDRLAEIEQMSWADKTPEILDEYDALVKQNEELQRNIDLLEERRSNQAKRQARSGGQVQQGNTYSFDGLLWSTGSEEEAWNTLASTLGIAGASIDEVKEKAKELGYVLQENAVMVKVDADAYNEDLTASMQEYAGQLNSTHSLNQDQLRDYKSLKVTVSERVEGLKLLEAQGDTLTESERNLIDVYDSLIETEAQAKEWTEKYGDALVITDEQAKQLIKTFPSLKNQLIDTGSGWTILNNNAQTAANGLISADGRIKKSSRDRTKVVLEDLNATITYYGLIARAFNTMGTASGYTATQAKQANELARSFDATRKQLQAAIARGIYDDTGSNNAPNTPPGTGASKTTKKATTAAKKATDLALEEFKNLQKDLEHQKELGLIKEEKYYDKLEQLIKDYKTKATAHMKEYGTDVDTINRNMYQYEEEIYKGRAKLADDFAEQQKKAAEKAAQAQKEALEQQKSDYETAINYVIKQIDKEIDKLQDLRDQTEQYYDDKIDALNDANDELERQIQYEQLLNNLAQAKDKQLYVFQNGQFQYVQDVEAIASAQAELDAYERDEALRKEVENLETLKEQALASIDEQIEGWENYKEQWESVTTQYQEQQDKLLAEQLLGIDTEQKNWETRLANVQNFVDQYNAILSQLNSGTTISSTSNAVGGGGANITSGSGGWSGIPHDADSDSNRDEVIKNDTSIGKGRDYLAEAIAAADKGDIDKAYALLDERDKKLDAQGRNSAGGVNKEESRDIINVHLDGYTTSKHANGTLSAPGGLSLVGERGPELRVLNSGDGIIPADATRNLWDWASYNPKDFMSSMGSDNIFHIGNIALPNVTDAKSFVNGLKQLAYQRAYKRA